MAREGSLPQSSLSSLSSDAGVELNITNKTSKDDLAKIPAFSRLSNMQSEKIAAITNKKHFSKDALIFNENDSGGQLFFVHQGEVKVVRGIRSRQEQTLSVAKSGDFFGVVSFIDGKEYSVSAVCSADSVVFIIDKTSFDELARQDPVIGLKILKVFSPIICSSLRFTNSRIKDLDNYVTSGS